MGLRILFIAAVIYFVVVEVRRYGQDRSDERPGERPDELRGVHHEERNEGDHRH